jgi:hypothetical protein
MVWMICGCMVDFPSPSPCMNRLTKDWFHSFILTYIERDLPFLGLSADPYCNRLLQMLAHNHGIAQPCQLFTGIRTIQPVFQVNWLLENAFMLPCWRPWFAMLKSVSSNLKNYLRIAGYCTICMLSAVLIDNGTRFWKLMEDCDWADRQFL